MRPMYGRCRVLKRFLDVVSRLRIRLIGRNVGVVSHPADTPKLGNRETTKMPCFQKRVKELGI